MAGSPLAQHLPSIFGPSRRAAWRRLVLRRLLALAALLLATHLAIVAASPSRPAATSPSPDGARVVVPLATPVDLPVGARVSVYASGRATPLTTRATLVETAAPGTGDPRADIAVDEEHVGRIVQELGASPPTTFVLIGRSGSG